MDITQQLSHPTHVPADIVVDFDIYRPEDGTRDVQRAWLDVAAGAPIKWTPRNGGHWLAFRAKDIKEIQTNYGLFSHRSISIPASSTVSIPAELDPPEHTPLRAVVSGLFSPAVLKNSEPGLRELSHSLIDGFKAQGRCEFQADFARHLPISIFMQLMDLPLSSRDMLLDYAEKRFRCPDAAVRDAVKAAAIDLLREQVEMRRKNPGTDFITRMMLSEVNGRPISDYELENMLSTVLSGGMDTVAAMLGFIIRFLAMNPKHWQRLRDEPAVIPRAVDELIRRHGIVNTARVITRDVEFGGMAFKEGEKVVIPNIFYGLDAELFPNPLEVDFDRPDAHAHAAFGNGPHRCPGSNLARLEIRVALEEWTRAIPAITLDPDNQPVMVPGISNSVAHLPLIWEPIV